MADYSLGTAHGEIRITSDTSGVDQTEQALGRIGKSAQSTQQALDSTARGMAVAGGAIAGGLGLAVKTAADFDAQLSAIAAVGGREATARMGEIREAALRIGADTKFSASEAAAAMEELVKAGIPVQDVLNGAADATVSLAAATGVDMPTAAGIASNAMNVFNLKASEMTNVADMMAQAANASAIDVTDLGMSMSQVGAVAKLAGLSLEDTITAIGEMGDAGIKGSDAGTSLKTMLSNLQPTTEKQSKAMQELGLVTEDGTNQFYDQEGRLKSLRDIQDLLHNSTKDLTAQEKQMALETIFGSDAIRAAAVLADGGAESFDEFGNKMENAGTAAEQAAIRQDNLKGATEQLMGSLETAAISIGSALTPVIRTLAEGLGKLVNWFNSLDSDTQQLIATVLAIAAGLLLFGAATIKTVQFVQKLLTTLRTLRLLSTATQPGFIKMAATATASFARTAASAVSSAATATGAWLAHVGRTLAAWARAAGAAIVNAAKIAAAWAASAARQVASWAFMAAQSALHAAKVAASWLITTGAAAARAIAQTALAVTRMLAQWLILGVQSLARAAMVALAWIVAMGPVGWAIALFALIVGVVILFWDEIVAAFQAAAAWVGSIMQGIWDWIKSVWDGIVQAFQNAKNFVINLLTQMWNAIKAIWDGVINFFRQIPGWIGGIFSSALNWLINAGRNIIQGLWNGIKAIWNAVIGWIGGIGSWIIGKLGDAGSWLLDIGRRIIEGLWNGISNAFGWLWDKISGFFGQIWDGIKDFFGVSSPSKLFRDELGKMLPQGLAIGIGADTDKAIQAATDMAEAVRGSVSMSMGGPDAFWDGSALGGGSVPMSPEVASHAASQGDTSNVQKVVNFNTYNPVAERASDSEARRLRALSTLGAF